MMKKVIASALAFTMFFACCAPAAAAENPASGGPLDGYPGIEELPQIDTIPDPFKFFDIKNDPDGNGYVSNVGEWEARRGEIKDLVQHYWLGYKWPTKAEDVQGTIKSVKGNVITAAITITNPERIVDGKAVTASFDAAITLPTEEQLAAAWGSADVKVPFVINMGSSAFSAGNLNPQGYALVTFNQGAIYPDSTNKPIPRNGVYTDLYPYDADQYEYASGALMAEAWACSQIITAMEMPSAEDSAKTLGQLAGLDPGRTVVTGHSRWGKAAMFAAAFDDRISICIPSEPGGSGIQSNRYKVEGKIFNFNAYAKANRVYGKTEIPTVSYGEGNSWFPDTAAMFVGKDNQIPFDSDEIIALIAPRPFFVVSGIDAHWLGNEGGVASVQAASEVYEFIGENEIEKNNIAVRVRESNHVFYPRDFGFALSIMDREFKQDSGDTALHVKDLFPNGTGLSGMSYPAEDYRLVSEFNSYPFDINSSYLPWSSPNKYVLWTSQENFLINHDVTITAHSNAPDVDMYLPDGKTKIDAASHDGEVFTFNVPAEQSIYGRYELRTDGGDRQNRSVFFAAVSLADSLRHGTTKGDEGEENRVLGFSSRLANTKADPPLVYIAGSPEPETMSFTAERFTEETTALLEYGILFHDNLFVRIGNSDEEPDKWTPDMTFNVKNLKFVTIPNYVFEFSMNDIAASSKAGFSFWGPGRPGTLDAAKFTKPISWPVEKYNNGPAAVWPPVPDTLDERAFMEKGGTIGRPEAPEQKDSSFKATLTDITSVQKGDNTEIKLTFSEPLNIGQYGIGLNVASKWTTSWNEEGTEMTLSIAHTDFTSDSKTAGILIFRLFDKEGSQLGGPIEASVELDRPVPEVITNALTAALEESRYLNSNRYTVASYTTVQNAIKAATTVLDAIESGDYVRQEEVNAAAWALTDALNALEYVTAPTLDRTEILAETARAQSIAPDSYTPESYAVLTNALREAIALLAVSDVTAGDLSGNDVSGNSQNFVTQKQLDTAALSLRKAISALTAIADLEELQKLVDIANAYTSDQYTDTSYAALASALKAAGSVLAQENPAAEEVTQAALALYRAISGLEAKPVTPPAPSDNGVSAPASQEITVDWNSVTAQVKDKASTGTESVLNVLAGSNAIVPVSTLEAIVDKPVVLALHTGDKLTFSVSGKDLPKTGLSALDLTVKQGDSLIPAAAVNEKTNGSMDSRQFETAFKGAFGMSMNVHLDMDKANAGNYANLYRYSTQSGKLEYLGSFKITADGQAMFGIAQGAGYLVTITREPVSETAVMPGNVYMIKGGDTFSLISKKCNMTVAQLKALNPQIADINKIYPNQKLNVR